MNRKRQSPGWTYAAASRTLPYIRLVLRDLREGFVSIWHLYKLARCDVNHPDYREQIRLLGDEARAILAELDCLGVIAYQSPLRGIALFPFVVKDDQGGSTREAYFVFRDTRAEIDAYILAKVACKIRLLAEGIVDAFIQTSRDLKAIYQRHPTWKQEVAEKVAGLLEQAFGGRSEDS